MYGYNDLAVHSMARRPGNLQDPDLSADHSTLNVLRVYVRCQYTSHLVNMSWEFPRCFLPDFSAITSLGKQAVMRWRYSPLGTCLFSMWHKKHNSCLPNFFSRWGIVSWQPLNLLFIDKLKVWHLVCKIGETNYRFTDILKFLVTTSRRQTMA